jgi:hypothetical protein
VHHWFKRRRIRGKETRKPVIKDDEDGDDNL